MCLGGPWHWQALETPGSNILVIIKIWIIYIFSVPAVVNILEVLTCYRAFAVLFEKLNDEELLAHCMNLYSDIWRWISWSSNRRNHSSFYRRTCCSLSQTLCHLKLLISVSAGWIWLWKNKALWGKIGHFNFRLSEMTKMCRAVLIETQAGALPNFHFHFWRARERLAADDMQGGGGGWLGASGLRLRGLLPLSTTSETQRA